MTIIYRTVLSRGIAAQSILAARHQDLGKQAVKLGWSVLCIQSVQLTSIQDTTTNYAYTSKSVSYTHLTLPTIYSV